MAVTRRGSGAVQAFGASAQPPYPTGAAAGDVCYVIAFNTQPIGSAPSGWTEVATTGGSAVVGYYGKVFKQTHPGGTPTAPIVSATGGSGGWAVMEGWYASTASATLNTAEIFGSDTDTSSTAFNAAAASLTTQNNDVLLMLPNLKSSATMSATHTSPTVLQAGATLGTQVGNFGARLAGASPTNSVSYGSYHKPVTTGATGVPSFTATGGTGAANVGGLVAVILLREQVVTNNPPTANAGVDQVVEPRVQVTLNGTGSSDSDGTIAGYLWTPPGGITLSSNTAASPTFTSPLVLAQTDYVFSLVVTDDDGASSSADTVTVTVRRAQWKTRVSSAWSPKIARKRTSGGAWA